jgi:hypothetical protein
MMIMMVIMMMMMNVTIIKVNQGKAIATHKTYILKLNKENILLESKLKELWGTNN